MANILNIPNEIKLRIFQYLVDDSYLLDRSHIFPLMAVCRDWRQLILREALFWRHIYISERSITPDGSLEENFLRAELAFKHSRNLPIDIIVEVPDHDEPCPWFNHLHTDMLARILRREAHRITSISITGNDWEMHLSVLNAFSRIPMPRLRKFHASIWEYIDVRDHRTYNEQRIILSGVPIPILQYPSEDLDMSKVNAWGREMYPNLQHINISGAPFNWRALPTSGLKTLSLGHQHSDTSPPFPLIQELLSFAAPTLQDLSLPGFLAHRGPNRDPTNPSQPPTTFPHLQSLSIAFESPDEFAGFLPYIRTPALKQISLTDTTNPRLFALASICTDGMVRAMMLHLPLHQLETLVIEHLTFKDDIPIPRREHFLERSPSLPYTMRFLATLTSPHHGMGQLLTAPQLPWTSRFCIPSQAGDVACGGGHR